MTSVRRLQAAAAVSAAVLAATCWQIGGATNRPKRTDAVAQAISTPRPKQPGDLESTGLFATRPVITYTATTGEAYFAYQLKPQLTAAVQPRDLIVMIDTSASQVGPPLQTARLITEALAKQAGVNDRIAVWTVNTPEETKNLTAGLHPGSDAKVRAALTQLERVVYAAGATDLKLGFKKVLASLQPTAGRHAAIVYLGDGDSVLSPLTESDRNRIAGELADRQITLTSVPLGRAINAKTVHGLATASGGLLVRCGKDDQPAEVATRVLKSIDQPVLYPTRAKFANAAGEVLPGKLPPLRGDVPTLVAGTLKPGDAIECTIEGTVAGKPVTITMKSPVPATEVTNYFLMNLVSQWRTGDRTAPAMMRADRGLALAYEQTRLARDEFLTQAQWALSENKLDVAGNLFRAANKIDPGDGEAGAGLRVVEKLKTGAMTRDQLLNEAKAVEGDRPLDLVKAAGAGQPPAAPAATPPAAPTEPPANDQQLIDAERRRRNVLEQYFTQMVDEAIRQARVDVNQYPEGAYEALKRQLSSVQENSDLSAAVRANLANRLQSAMRTTQARGAEIRQRRESDRDVRIAIESRRSAEGARLSDEERIRTRVKLIGEQMDRARYEESYKEALDLQRELVSKGRRIPPAVHAGYVMNTNAAAIRDYEEMRRLKEERYLLTMLQVDKSHIPFPDEPPVAYPPAAFWKEISELRKDKYSSDGLGGFSRKAVELRDKLARPVSIDRDFQGMLLKDFLDYLSDRYEMTILINPAPFREGGEAKIEDSQVKVPKMPGVSLSTLLTYALSPLNATYLVRRDYVEITTRKAAGYEKTVRAYPVADLVIPIPNAVDQLSLQQNLQVLGGSLSANGQAIFGSAGGGLNFGNFGVFGGGGFNLGGVGGIGGLGLGGGAGGQAFLGGGGPGQQGGQLGFAGGVNQTNLGVGGGVLGFGGGQQGQFGNLGGQFGLQGGDTSNILIRLIEDTIAPKEWNTTAARYLQVSNLERPDEDMPPLDIQLLNSMGYYQPSRALIVRGSARVHSRIGEFANAAGPMGAANKVDRGGDVIVFEPKKNKPAAAAAPAPKTEVAKAPAKAPETAVKKTPHDPKTVWHDELAKGHILPRQVIAVADVLAHCEKFEEVAELLKADLRHGVLAHQCVFEALAVALQGCGASVEEVERVRYSRIDVEPQVAQAYMDVARAMDEMGRHDKSLEFCKRAAAIEPASADPYYQALVMAKSNDARTSDAVAWAAGNLLDRDWGVEGPLFHQQAKTTLNDLAAKFDAQGRKSDADKLRAVFAANHERDLVIEMAYADQADIDLIVSEPVGTVCSVKTPRTPAGGQWTGDQFGNNSEHYAATRAFGGSYQVSVRRIWGEPLGGKVTVRVTKHQGSPREAVELHTLRLDADGTASLKVQLADGRRTATEPVPTDASVRRLPINRGQSRDEINALLRSMADPSMAGVRPGMSVGSGLSDSARATTNLEAGVELTHQTKVAPALSSGVDLLTQTTISADRSTMKVSLHPAFNVATNIDSKVSLAMIPGGK